MLLGHLMVNPDVVLVLHTLDEDHMPFIRHLRLFPRQLHAVALDHGFAHRVDHVAAYRTHVKPGLHHIRRHVPVGNPVAGDQFRHGNPECVRDGFQQGNIRVSLPGLQEILAIAMRQSAADCACSEEDFRRDRNVVVESKKAEGTSRFLNVPHICALFSYGSNIVASCRADLIPEVTAFVDGYESVYRCFDTPGLYELNRILEKAGARVDWMHNFYLPDPEQVYGAELPCPYETREMYPEDFTELYVPDWSQGVPKWSNALSHARKELEGRGGADR